MVGLPSPFSIFRSGIAGLSLIALAPQVAHAAVPALAVNAAGFMATDCSNPVQATDPVSLAPRVPSKAAQILGGSSALEAVRARQASVPTTHPLFSAAKPRVFEPAAAPAPRRKSECSIKASPFAQLGPINLSSPSYSRPRPSPAVIAALVRTDVVLGSRLVPIARTAFDAQWQRLSASRPDLTVALLRLGMTQGSRADLAAAVNRWVNREIAHAEDIELYGRRDFWADAATTLRLGRGDCEDFALLKMELLAAAGVAREDMMLTLAYDTIRRRDHAVLLVKTEEGMLLLDNVGNAPLDAKFDHGYRPVMSLGAGRSWLHGY